VSDPVTDSGDRDDRVTISRREVIRRAALAMGLVVSPAWLASVDRLEASTQTPAPTLRLTTSELAITEAIADRIVPRTSTPGAKDVGVPAFIDVLYGQFMTPAERDRFTNGLAAVNEAATKTRGTPFTSLATMDQDDVLREIARASQDQPNSFFQQIKTATILGYFTSEQVGRNVLHYDPIPGRYDPCVPTSEVGNVSWTT
jgi:gluconate 2-dehydrogenase gamma chain